MKADCLIFIDNAHDYGCNILYKDHKNNKNMRI